jgi:hypothetical protein
LGGVVESLITLEYTFVPGSNLLGFFLASLFGFSGAPWSLSMFPKPSRASLGSLDKESDYILPIGKGLSCIISVVELDLVLPQPILLDYKL